AWWNSVQDASGYIEAVHRLDTRGAIFVNVIKGSSTSGFDAEWRIIEIVTTDDDLVSRVELFDEADLDAALARFEELCRPEPPLENAASRRAARFYQSFAGRDWDGLADALADDIAMDDRRKVVGAG